MSSKDTTFLPPSILWAMIEMSNIFFRSSKDYRHLSDHEIFFACLKVLKKDKHLSVDLEMNRLSTVIFLLSCCISFLELGYFILMIAFIFLILASIFHCDIKNSKFFLKVTPNVYLVRFNFIWCRRSVLNISFKFRKWSEVWRFFTNISSI